MSRIAIVLLVFVYQSVVLGDSTGGYTDSHGNPVSGCRPCFSFKFGSCLSEFGPQGAPEVPTPCPPVECFLEGSCQLASLYYKVYDQFYNAEEQIMVKTAPNASGYHARSDGGKLCTKTLGCDDCVLNPDTFLMSCQPKIYIENELFYGKICYWDNDNSALTPPTPVMCIGDLPWLP